MSIPGILDALLILTILAYFSYGWIVGFIHSAFSMAGIVGGGIAAFFAIPMIGSWIPWPQWRLPLILVAVLVLVVAGQTLGSLIGRAIRHRVEKSALGVLDRIAGAILNAVVAALVASMVAFSIGSLGVPLLSQAIAGSTVLRTIEQFTPAPVRSGMAQLRSVFIQQGIPRIISAAGTDTSVPAQPAQPAQSAQPPSVNTATPPLTVAALSVVKVTGTAYQCGQNQSGSGFIAARNRVVTNAHVVAGVSEPVVEVPNVGAFTGRVVYFDPTNDLAIIAVTGMPTSSISLGETLPDGTDAVFDGYPLGGPFESNPARVDRVINVRVNDIYGRNPHTMQVYQLAAQVQEGNSGGPLLSTKGEVVGVVFAKAANEQSVGYAQTMDEVGPVARQASALNSPVSPGSCIQH